MNNDNLNADAFSILLDAYSAALEGKDVQRATSDAIVASEKRGQQKLVNSMWLPREMCKIAKQQLEDLGFNFLDGGDDLFYSVELPAGWYKPATDHDMWSSLHDGTGAKRADIFYKAAFYDRSATLYWIVD